jgi:Ala-tRNA(Pro) deacylase
MGMAITLQAFFESHPLHYSIVSHDYTESTQRSAAAVHQTGFKVAKSVLLKDGESYLLAVLPACYRLHLGQLHRALGRDLGLATETEVAVLFGDCVLGAIPPAGVLYDLDTIVDEALLEQDDIYFEAGDHEQLIHMKQADFTKLLGDARRGRFSVPG